MSKLGLTCLILVLIGLAAESYIGAKLGMRRGEVDDQLRKAIVDSEKAIEANSKAVSELGEAHQLLASTKIGWGREWNFPAGGNVGSVQLVGAKLAVTGLGTANGLVAEMIKDASGQERYASPVVHVFALNGQGGSVYIGEFVAGIGPNELSEQNATLTPTWNVSAQEVASWNFTAGVRLRSQIPAGARASVENAHQTITRTFEQLTQTGLRIEEQKGLNEKADLALAGRKNELLGDPAAADIDDHPEYKLGLVQALENLEEERNAVQVAVDELRRLIKTASEYRQQQMDTLKQVVSQMRQSGTKLSKRSE